MKIKKYEAGTEQEAMIKIKEELGKDAVILNIKRINPKGFFKLFNKPKVEVTAAYDENSSEEVKSTDYNDFQNNLAFIRDLNEARKADIPVTDKTLEIKKDFPIMEEKVQSSKDGINAKKSENSDMDVLEKKIDHLEALLNRVTEKVDSTEKNILQKVNRNYDNEDLCEIYNNLIENEVLPEVAEALLEGVDEILRENNDNIELALKIIYNRIIDMLGEIKPIVINDKPQVVVIMGSTGVGKTTTIAKLSSYFILNEQKKVGLITADTYRIAAVEQLKVYADILGIDVSVVYSENEINKALEKFNDKDIIFVDTAGRSHKNGEQLNELNLLLEQMPNCQKYLILSMATKYRDAVNIVQTYSKMSDYSIIFTKSDETMTKGLILNVCYLTGKPLSYVTMGQNVPDDIGLINPQEIAKELLGSMSK